jgi:hypothetical protein
VAARPVATPSGASVAPFREFFGRDVRFGAKISAVVFHSRWLDHPIAGADPKLYSGILGPAWAVESAQPPNFIDHVRRAIHVLLFADSLSTAGIAQLFGLSERTLQRRRCDPSRAA